MNPPTTPCQTRQGQKRQAAGRRCVLPCQRKIVTRDIVERGTDLYRKAGDENVLVVGKVGDFDRLRHGVRAHSCIESDHAWVEGENGPGRFTMRRVDVLQGPHDLNLIRLGPEKEIVVPVGERHRELAQPICSKGK